MGLSHQSLRQKHKQSSKRIEAELYLFFCETMGCWKIAVVLIVLTGFNVDALKNTLKKGGANVCVKQKSEQRPRTVTLYRLERYGYSACCRHIFGHCVHHCTKYRQRVVSYTKQIMEKQHAEWTE